MRYACADERMKSLASLRIENRLVKSDDGCDRKQCTGGQTCKVRLEGPRGRLTAIGIGGPSTSLALRQDELRKYVTSGCLVCGDGQADWGGSSQELTIMR